MTVIAVLSQPALTPERLRRASPLELFLDNLARFKRGEPLRNVVDPVAGY